MSSIRNCPILNLFAGVFAEVTAVHGNQKVVMSEVCSHTRCTNVFLPENPNHRMDQFGHLHLPERCIPCQCCVSVGPMKNAYCKTRLRCTLVAPQSSTPFHFL